MSILLEQMALDSGTTSQLKAKKESNPMDCYEFEPSPIIIPTSTTPASSSSSSTSTSTTTTATSIQQQEVLDSLSELYAALKEEDLWAGLWQKRAKYNETNMGISFELQGYYEKAQNCYEQGMVKAKSDSSNSANCFTELKLWEDHWIKYVVSLF
jgi:hypothetical protein